MGLEATTFNCNLHSRASYQASRSQRPKDREPKLIGKYRGVRVASWCDLSVLVGFTEHDTHVGVLSLELGHKPPFFSPNYTMVNRHRKESVRYLEKCYIITSNELQSVRAFSLFSEPNC